MKRKTFYCLLAALCLYVSVNAQDTLSVSGIITSSESGLPVDGASISYNQQKITISDAQGRFRMKGLAAGSMLHISCVGYLPQHITVTKASNISVRLQASQNELDEAVVLGYGKTSKRFNTGSVAQVSATEIARMPISNPLAALAGRVTGVDISQTNGLPGASFNVVIRGKASLFNGTAPLYVIDGVPFLQNRTGNQLYSAMVASPLNAINPADIERIEVLKDADATAIYGSQGANGVILVTTKKATSGKTNVNASYYAGVGKITRPATPMQTAPYLAMRRQAFVNDGVTPTISTAPDLLLWDTTAYTNWQQEFTGGVSHIQNAELSLSGGSGGTRFLLSGNYNGQTTVYPQSKPVQRVSGYFNLVHQPLNSRFKAQLSSSISDYYVRAPFVGLASSVYLPPNAPALYDSSGKLNWTDWTGVDNPMAQLERNYNSHTYVLNSSVVLGYQLLPDLSVRLHSGISQQRQDEYRSSPISAQRPSTSNKGSADWQDSRLMNWMVEPQLDYLKHFGALRTEIIAGVSWQNRSQEASAISGTQYSDDDLLGDPQSAGQIAVNYSSSQYRYLAYFGRAVLQYKGRYLLSLNGRRDGSSRFSPGVRFSNFGSVAGGWIFSEEAWIKKVIPFLSYGKLRSSYGVTGNDQVGDYSFLNAWGSPSTGNYQSATSLVPGSLYNPYLQWERNKKLEVALELGWWNNRLLASAAWYRNRCDNQLIGLILPTQTGFSSISSNRDALIENSGWEIEISGQPIKGKLFSWQSSLNVSIPRSRLIRYPGLERSSSRFTYALDESLNVLFGYRYAGIDPQTNIYQFEDVNKDGLLNSTGDYVVLGAIEPKLYGGFNNVFSFKGLELEVLIQGLQQDGKNYLQTLPSAPGMLSNQPELILHETLQKYTSKTGTVNTAYRNYQKSSALLSDASYLRLKNVSLSYRLPEAWMQRLSMTQLMIYLQGQNLVTITKYKGADPETQSVVSLPPIKNLVVGVRVGF